MSKLLAFAILFLTFMACAMAQVIDTPGTQTMRPVIRGQKAAVSSMRSQATEAARRILEAGGNALDAAVVGQAVLGLTDFADNGLGSDAVVLVYVANDKQVYSVNAEPRAPKLATIEWYEKNNGGKIPESDGLLSGGLPGVVDAISPLGVRRKLQWSGIGKLKDIYRTVVDVNVTWKNVR